MSFVVCMRRPLLSFVLKAADCCPTFQEGGGQKRNAICLRGISFVENFMNDAVVGQSVMQSDDKTIIYLIILCLMN